MNEINQQQLQKLQALARELRCDILRMIHGAKSGHPGGSLSAVEIVTALYFSEMNIDPQRPDWPGRDRFVLSKGHGCPALYAALAHRGYFAVDELNTLRQYHSILQGHPDCRKTPGIDMSTGSLGNGLSVGLGMALAARVDNLSYSVYVLLGDGELQEGMVWEAAMAAHHHHVDQLIAIVDRNRLQINGDVENILGVEPLAEKWQSFGWQVIHTDGHDLAALITALRQAKAIPGPTVIIADTIKGKGVSFMENIALWHGQAPTEKELAQALAELSEGGVGE